MKIHLRNLFSAVISESGNDQCMWALSHHAASIQCHAIECHNVLLLSTYSCFGTILNRKELFFFGIKRFESLFSAERGQMQKPFC